MRAYYEDHEKICSDSRARQSEKVQIEKRGKIWDVEAIITDIEEANDWSAHFTVDLQKSEALDAIHMTLSDIRPIGL